MDFTIDCPCGAEIRVRASDAGSVKECRCGRLNDVPPLSELRRRAGQQPYEVSVVDRIRYLVAEGKLPADNNCAGCGFEASGVLVCHVECESLHATSAPAVPAIVLYFLSFIIYFFTLFFAFFTLILSPFWVWRRYLREDDAVKIHGHEVVVNAPLAMCPACAKEARKSERRLRDLLRRVPVYHQLFELYPKARIHVS